MKAEADPNRRDHDAECVAGHCRGIAAAAQGGNGEVGASGLVVASVDYFPMAPVKAPIRWRLPGSTSPRSAECAPSRLCPGIH